MRGAEFRNVKYYDWNGHELGEMDRLVVDNENLVITVYEMKRSRNEISRMRAIEQLERSSKFFREIAPEYKIRRKIVYGKA